MNKGRIGLDMVGLTAVSRAGRPDGLTGTGQTRRGHKGQDVSCSTKILKQTSLQWPREVRS